MPKIIRFHETGGADVLKIETYLLLNLARAKSA